MFHGRLIVYHTAEPGWKTVYLISDCLQVLNGHSIKAEEVTKAQEMFKALHEARVNASKQPLNELVRRALTAIHSTFHASCANCRPAHSVFCFECCS